MSEERDRLVEQMLQDYQSHRGKMTDMLQQMQEINPTATSPRREVTITASQHGGMSDIKFPGQPQNPVPVPNVANPYDPNLTVRPEPIVET
jgi:hypothetical protein